MTATPAARCSRVDLILDVDGVLSPILLDPTALDTVDWWPVRALAHPLLMPCWYAPDLIARLNTLTGRPGVRGHWLTSWREDAPTAFAPAVGLRTTDGTGWPVLPEADGPDAWWKANAVAAHLAVTDAHRVLWVDDDITDWINETARPARWLDDPRLTYLSPALDSGLTPAQMTLIEDLCAASTAALCEEQKTVADCDSQTRQCVCGRSRVGS